MEINSVLTKSESKTKKRKRVQKEQNKTNESKKTKKRAKKNDSPTNYLTSDTTFLEKFRAEHLIGVHGTVTNFKPFENFSEGSLQKYFSNITSSFSKPTPIQSQCWPILLSKHDVVGIAQTGSGKTLAFGLPGLLHVKSHFTQTTLPSMLVLAPTRELAMQTEKVLTEAATGSKLKVVCLYGGVGKLAQVRKLRKGARVVVATPGRLLDLVQDGECDLSEVTYLVLDEADRMLDMGFEKEITQILGYLPPQNKRQTAMFSATWPTSIQKIAGQYLNSPIRVTIGTLSEGLSSNGNVTQIVEVIEDKKRNDRVITLLIEYHINRKNRVLIFVLYKKEAPRLENTLNKQGWKANSIHGDKSQFQRTTALNAFIDGSCPLLVATDVAARGLDIPQVEYVINYSFPLTIEDYVHRIGRTGRAGAKGISHTFFQSQDKHRAGELVHVLKEAKQEVPEGLLQWGLVIKKIEPKLGKIDMNTSSSTGHIIFDSDDE